jgi:hypothetical protein
MSDDKRKPKGGNPSVWVTHLSGLLSGDKQCEFAAWFKSRYWYSKLPDSTFDAAAWTSDHNALVQSRAQSLKDAGWTVTLEDQNKFEIIGQVGSIVGKQDIVATTLTPGDPPVALRVEDCKTGKPRHSDWWQVLLYIYAQKRKHPELKDRITGMVVYKDHEVAVQAVDLTAERIAQIGALMKKLCGPEQATAVPSKRECGMCDIGAQYCSARFVEQSGAATASTFDF